MARLPDPLPRLPAWAGPDFTWAPEVLAIGPSEYVLYYTGGIRLNRPIVAMAAMPWSDGHWLMAADSGVFAFGAAPLLGSAGDVALRSPIVHGRATPAGDAYWLVGADAGVFTYGRAGYFGSTGGQTLTRPLVGMAT